MNRVQILNLSYTLWILYPELNKAPNILIITPIKIIISTIPINIIIKIKEACDQDFLT